MLTLPRFRAPARSAVLPSRLGWRRVAPALAGLAAVAALSLGSATAAQAAIVSDPITKVVVTPADPAQNSQLTTTIDFCVPNGTQKGDTFTLTLSQYLTDLPTGFNLRDPKTNAVVATASLTDTTPAVITFTMTSYAATHLDTCGTAFVKSNFDNTQVRTGQTVPFTSTTGFGTSFTSQITPTGTIGDRSSAIKYGTFTRSDEGRANGADFLSYHIDTPNGPFDRAVLSDPVPAGQKWRFDCSTIQFADVTTDAAFTFVSTTPATPTSSTCTSTGLTVVWGPQVANHYFEVLISASLAKPTGTTSAPATFDNTAAVSTFVGAVETPFVAPASNVQSSAGGSGFGTPVSTSPASPAPAPSTAPAPAASAPATPVAVVASGSGDTELAYTGSETAPEIGIAAGFVGLGVGALVFDVRRRRRA